MNSILIVNVNWVGDVVFSSPVFKALKEKYPQAKISCMAVPRVREVLECIPCIDDIIIYDEKGKHKGIFQKIKFVLGLRRRKFDIAFLLHRSLTRALLVFFAGISQRVGYDEKGRGFLLTHKTLALPGMVHRSDHYLNVIESYGITLKDRTTNLVVSKQAQHDIIEELNANDIKPDDFIVAINPGGNWDLKRWSVQNFFLLINRLVQDKNIKVIVSGAQKDDLFIKEIIQGSFGHQVISLAGRTTLKQLMALMERANVVVSADSGPMHLANSVGTDVVAIFGPTRPEITGPRGKGRAFILQDDVGCNRQACYYLECPDNICMQSITVERVLDAVREVQNQKNTG